MNKYAITADEMLTEGVKATRDYDKFVKMLQGNAAGEDKALAEAANELLADPRMLKARFGGLANDYARAEGQGTFDELAKLNQRARANAISREVAAGNPNPVLTELNKLSPTVQDQVVASHMSRPAADPSTWEAIKAWIAANPGKSTAIGAGALGLGGLGAYAMMSGDDEEEEGRKKSAGYIDPYVAQVLAHDYITKMASANGIPTVAAGVTGLSNYLNLR
jgi:hypothetical protein